MKVYLCYIANDDQYYPWSEIKKIFLNEKSAQNYIDHQNYLIKCCNRVHDFRLSLGNIHRDSKYLEYLRQLEKISRSKDKSKYKTLSKEMFEYQNKFFDKQNNEIDVFIKKEFPNLSDEESRDVRLANYDLYNYYIEEFEVEE